MLTHLCGPAPLSCSLLADFSRLAGDTPYVVTIDLARSVLQPEGGARQRFAYRIEPSGAPGPRRAAKCVLGLCADIPFSALEDIRVAADGRALKEPVARPLGEGRGILLDSPLNQIQICLTLEFDLAMAYPVGEMPVRIAGVEGELPLCGPVCAVSPANRAAGYSALDLRVPFSLPPGALLGKPLAWCCGEPRVQAEAPGQLVFVQRVVLALPAEPAARLKMGPASAVPAEEGV